LQGLIPVFGSVVHTRQNMRMDINHGRCYPFLPRQIINGDRGNFF
jgi:hypothetical protein